MGKIEVNEIDFDELDNVVADILLEKDAPEAEQLVEPEIIEETKVIESKKVIEDKGQDLADSAWRVMRRARRMSDMGLNERLQHENVRTTKRFGLNLKPINSQKAAAPSPSESKKASLSFNYTIDSQKSQEFRPKKTPQTLKKSENTDHKNDQEIKLQQEILWEITKEIKKKERKSVAATNLHKTAARSVAKKSTAKKPGGVKSVELKPILTKTSPIASKPVIKSESKLRSKLDVGPKSAQKTTSPKTDSIKETLKFEGDEFSEEIDESKAVLRTETPFLGGIKVDKKPLGEAKREGNVSTLPDYSLEVVLPKTKQPQMSQAKQLKQPKQVKERKADKSNLGSWIFIIIIMAAIGVLAGIFLFYLSQ